MDALTACHHTVGDGLLVVYASAGADEQPPRERGQLLPVGKGDVGSLEVAGALHPDCRRAVDEHVGDGRIRQQNLEGAESEERALDLLAVGVEILVGHRVGKDRAQVRTPLRPLETCEFVVLCNETQQRIHGNTFALRDRKAVMRVTPAGATML